MADDVPPPAEASDGPTDPGERGGLVVRDKVAQRLALRAALDTPGVRSSHAAGLGKLTGRELPRVRVDVSGTRVRAQVSIAVDWPQPLADVGAAVRRNVATVLNESAGFYVDGVDVAIESIVTPVEDHTRTVL